MTQNARNWLRQWEELGRGHHLKSPTLLVWPPWMKSSSGGPSSASSGLCSSPMRLRLHTFTRRSAEHEPRIVSSNDAHWTPSTCRRGAGTGGERGGGLLI